MESSEEILLRSGDVLPVTLSGSLLQGLGKTLNEWARKMVGTATAKSLTRMAMRDPGEAAQSF
jgi:hypothetical protein